MIHCEKLSKSNIVTFDSSKVRSFDSNECKACFIKLASRGFTVAISISRISAEMLFKSAVFVFMGSKEDLEIKEIYLLKEYIKKGGKLLITGHCGKPSNINLLLEPYGIGFVNDTVFRMHRYRNYYHPCESFISDGVVNDSIYSMETGIYQSSILESFPIIYPYGCTLNVKHPAVTLMSTGNYCFPFNRPICAFYKHMPNNGRIVAVGSTSLFLNNYVNKEQNLRLFQIVMNLLTEENIQLNLADLQSPDIQDYTMIPCTAQLSDKPFCYLQETNNSQDSNVFRGKHYQFDNRYFPTVLNAYKELETEHENLRTIKPKFESPLPLTIPALIPPRFRDLQHPALELMDLDEFFMSADLRLGRLTFKCNDDDLEYYIIECAKAFNIPKRESSKCVLHYVCNEISAFRKNGLFYL